MVIHNENLQGTTNGPNRPVGELTVAELKQLDAGSWFHPAFEGVRIPTFEEVLAMGIRQEKKVALFNFSRSPGRTAATRRFGTGSRKRAATAC